MAPSTPTGQSTAPGWAPEPPAPPTPAPSSGISGQSSQVGGLAGGTVGGRTEEGGGEEKISDEDKKAEEKKAEDKKAEEKKTADEKEKLKKEKEAKGGAEGKEGEEEKKAEEKEEKEKKREFSATTYDPIRDAMFQLNARAYDKSLDTLNRLLLSNPNHPQGHYLRAVVYVMMRRYPDAAREYKEVIRLTPSSDLGRRASEGLKKISL